MTIPLLMLLLQLLLHLVKLMLPVATIIIKKMEITINQHRLSRFTNSHTWRLKLRWFLASRLGSQWLKSCRLRRYYKWAMSLNIDMRSSVNRTFLLQRCIQPTRNYRLHGTFDERTETATSAPMSNTWTNWRPASTTHAHVGWRYLDVPDSAGSQCIVETVVFWFSIANVLPKLYKAFLLV